jgi:hypothetical protein
MDVERLSRGQGQFDLAGPIGGEGRAPDDHGGACDWF